MLSIVTHGFLYLCSNLHWPEALAYLSRRPAREDTESPFYVEFLAKNGEGWTCLHCLICFNSPLQLINKLFSTQSLPTKVALCSTADTLGNLPIHVASRNSNFNDLKFFKKLIQLHPVGLFSSNFKGMRPIDFAQCSVGERSSDDKDALLKLLKESEDSYREYCTKVNVTMCIKRHLSSNSGPRCLFMPSVGDAAKKGYRNKACDMLFAANVLIEVKDKHMEGIFDSILQYAFGPRLIL